MNKILEGVIIGVYLGIVYIISGFIIHALWNVSVAVAFKLPAITTLQAGSIMCICQILFTPILPAILKEKKDE